MKSMTCDECRVALSDILANETDSGSSAAVEAHLAACGACRADAQDLVWQDMAVSEIAGKDRTREILARFHSALGVSRARSRRPARQGSLPWLGAAAAILLVSAALIWSLASTETAIPDPNGSTAAAPVPPPPPPTPPRDLPAPKRQPTETPRGETERVLKPAPEPSVPIKPAPKPVPPPPPKKPVVKPEPKPAPKVEPRTLPVIATLTRVRGEVFVGEAAVKEGQQLLEGQRVEMREGPGRSVVAFKDGTELQLRKGSVLSKLGLTGGKKVFVENGTVVASVKPQPRAEPMVFTTPEGEATVLGTTLRVVVSGNRTRVDVREGRVRVRRLLDDRNVILSTGQYTVAAQGEPLSRRKLLPALHELAAALKPGEWAELETEGFEVPEILVKPWMTILVETEEAMWDPVKGQLHVIGYTSQEETSHIVYDERTNTWEKQSTQKATSWYGPGYDHLAFDPGTRSIFFRQHNHDLIHRLDIRTLKWESLPRMPDNPTEIGAIEYFPEMGGLVFVGGGSVYVYRFRTKKWEILVRALDLGPANTFTEYDPVHKVMLIGGGNGQKKLYRLDASGMIVPLREAPIGLGPKDSLLVAEPGSGKLLAMARPEGRDFYEYDVLRDRWTKLPAPPVRVMPNTRRCYTTAASIPRWGVVLYLTADEVESHVYVYRHGRTR